MTWEKKLLLLTAEGWRYPAEPMSSIGDHSSWQRELKRERSEPLSVCPVSKAVYQEPISMHCPADGYGRNSVDVRPNMVSSGQPVIGVCNPQGFTRIEARNHMG